MPKKNLVIIFTERVDTVVDEIVKTHSLQQTDDEIAQVYREKKLPKVVILYRLIKDLLRENISTQEFLDKLRKDLNISPEATGALAKDIMQKLIPLLDKVPEDELDAYRTKKDEEERGEQGGDLAQEILRKINIQRGIPVTEPEEQANPVKRVTTSNVEENAKNMPKNQDYNPPKEVPIETPEEKFKKDEKFVDEKKGPDDYREPIQ